MKAEDVREVFTVPQEKKFVIYLVKEELKSWKLFNILQELGVENSSYQASHSPLILSLIGLDNDSWDISDFYSSVLEKHSRDLEPNEHSLLRQALLVILDLERKRTGHNGKRHYE